MEWLDRAVVAIDGTNLALTRSVTIPSEFDDDEVIDEIKPGNWGLKFNLVACVDGHAKQPLGVSVTAGETREPTQFDHLQDDVEVFTDLDSPIHVFDRGYLDYDRFCALKEREEDFVCLLQSDSRVDVLDSLQDIDITDEAGTRHVRDDLIELAEPGETLRRILFEDVDGEVIAYLSVS